MRASSFFSASLIFSLAIAACDGDVTSSGAGAGSGSGAGSGAGGPICGSDVVGLEGSLDGESLREAYPRVVGRVRDDLFATFFRDRGDVYLFGESNFEVGATVKSTGFFRMPAAGPSAGEVFCAGEGSSATRGASGKTFSLTSLSRLGACPGTAVSGEITACLGSSECILGDSLEGTLGPVSFDWGDAILGYSGSFVVYEVHLGNGAVLVLDIELDTVLGGLLFTAPTDDDPGAVYCVGSGQLFPGGGNAIEMSLGGLSRLGACSEAEPVEGSIEGCTP